MKKKKNTFKNSEKIWKRAIKVIPCGTQTLSKAPNQFVQGITPKFLIKGKGCYVWDVDGNEYIDYVMALGPIILGNNYPAVNKAVIEQLYRGTIFTLPHPLEVKLAELLVEVIPCAEMVRFGKNGVDATTAAVRAARAYTTREHIAYCGYHGYQDWYAIVTERNKGIPKIFANFMHSFEYNNIKTLEEIFNKFPNKIACIIMEQPTTEPVNNFLQRVINLAHKNGAIFILDEIVTGFRYSLGGAQQYYNILPDLACFGKGMANGFPISAVVGKKEIMKEFEEVFFSTTFGGETLSLAASIATIKELKEKNIIDYIWEKGGKLREGIIKIIEETNVNLLFEGNSVRSVFIFKDKNNKPSLEMKSLFLQETIKRGILFGVPVFVSFSHTDKDIDTTLEVFYKALRIVKKAYDEDNIDKYMKGKKIESVFRPR